MAKRIFLTLCLLTGALWASVPLQAVLAAPDASQPPVTEEQPTTEQETSVAATLSLEDLPPGFTELPPELASEIASRLDVLRQQLGQESLKPENFFAFVNQQNFQIVLGFTGKIPNEPQQADFDASLQQLNQPEVQQLMLTQLRQRLNSFGGIKVTDYSVIPGLNGLANASMGISLEMEMQGQPLRLDFAAFRRNTVGAFTAVMYPTDEQPKIGISDLVQKLDGRIVELSADANRSPLARVR